MSNKTFDTTEQENLINGKTVLSLNLEKENDDRTEDQIFYDWTQQGCPILEEDEKTEPNLSEELDKIAMNDWLRQNL